jgi:phage tail sheath protein FI
MYGDKTLLGIESSFSRINVRRLFIILEKTIATAANSLLLEFNDEFTQRRFVSIVEPFLRNVKGRRGITDFKVVADNRVNTPEVIQANRFVGQVFVKPNYSINFIRLDFVAVGNSASFDEVIGSI